MEVLRVSGQVGFSGNAYLLTAAKPTLIDVGLDGEELLRNINKHIDPRDISNVILTHSHYDHVAALDHLLEHTEAKVMIHEDELPLFMDPMGSAAAMFGGDVPRTLPQVLLKDGDEINLGDCRLEVIHTPGHTPGGICLLQSGNLFTGDTVFTYGNIGRTDLTGGNGFMLIKSIERLLTLQFDRLYPGHYEPSGTDLHEQLEKSLNFAVMVNTHD